ncbi:tetratricopeptide repeat protein [Armatimonas sp.]|uniref:ATP-binding protein n=1 Tax=Armatimonas sp. TaxID=1872638 RepID=UPI00286CC376|nr:tetratricopeptide repeat protein [Armatimonas sp.]
MIPPAGTVTLLFTDIEGSTRLWDTHIDAMRVALVQHDDLLRKVIEQNRGYVFKTLGDGFCAAFAHVPDALMAALEIQHQLLAQVWPTPTPLRVRTALHTGAVESRDNDYFGPALNRVARLLATGHGGQILLTQVTQELAEDTVPDETCFTCLGEHQLRDLTRSELVYQLCHPALPERFPPLKSLSTHPQNLPQQLTNFIGRESQIREVEQLLARVRLLTLTGAGGCGKTRLSLQVATAVLPRFPDGVWFVELAPLVDPGLVWPTVANVLGIQEQHGQPWVQTLLQHLKDKRLLLVLDNCEHLVDACAQLADVLLRGCPELRILASSREALRISGEQHYRVPSLSLPEPTLVATAENLTTYESVRLLVDRARLVCPDFQVTEADAPTLAQICVQLDGIPLAIELAAARVRSLSLEEINHGLGQRFQLLTGGSRTALPRQQTLQSLIDWSYDLLSDAERRTLDDLSVFTGGCTLDAAQAVCGVEVHARLTALCDKSLALYEESENGGRYRLLESIRQYAQERLQERGAESAGGRHRDYFLELAEEAEPKLRGPQQQVWLERLELEHDNLRTALSWCQVRGIVGDGLRLVGALWKFWEVYGYQREGREHIEAVLAWAGADAPTPERAKALMGAGVMAYFRGDPACAQGHFSESRDISRTLQDKVGLAAALNALGNLELSEGNLSIARTLYEEALSLRRTQGDNAGMAGTLNNLGSLTSELGDYSAALTYCEQALVLNRELGNRLWESTNLQNLGNIYRYLNDNIAAERFCQESIALSRELGNRDEEAGALYTLGWIALDRQDHTTAKPYFEQALIYHREAGKRSWEARDLAALSAVAAAAGDISTSRALFDQALRLQQEIGSPLQIVLSLDELGDIFARTGSPDNAALLWGAAERQREEFGKAISSPKLHDTDRVKATLGEAAYATTWAGGRALTLDEAVALALQALNPLKSASKSLADSATKSLHD